MKDQLSRHLREVERGGTVEVTDRDRPIALIVPITGADSALTNHDTSILANGRTQSFFAGGTVGVKYTVTNRIVTGQTPPVTDDRSFYVLVVNK